MSGIVIQIGLNPVWFGVMLVILIEMGLVTPPVGFNLFVVASCGNEKVEEVIRGSFPYVILMSLMLLIINLFPWLALWLPQALK
jgi:C4-dicarboxylate transporter DctM subunit